MFKITFLDYMERHGYLRTGSDGDASASVEKLLPRFDVGIAELFMASQHAFAVFHALGIPHCIPIRGRPRTCWLLASAGIHSLILSKIQQCPRVHSSWKTWTCLIGSLTAIFHVKKCLIKWQFNFSPKSTWKDGVWRPHSSRDYDRNIDDRGGQDHFMETVQKWVQERQEQHWCHCYCLGD